MQFDQVWNSYHDANGWRKHFAEGLHVIEQTNPEHEDDVSLAARHDLSCRPRGRFFDWIVGAVDGAALRETCGVSRFRRSNFESPTLRSTQRRREFR
jgi:hypothetical protein